MQAKFNQFTKDPSSKTAFVLIEGQPIFSQKLYVLQPSYIHRRSPSFTLVANGKHLTGLFPSCAKNVFLGDYQKKAVIVFMRELGFDLFTTDLDPISAKSLLCSGELTEILSQARQIA